MKIQKLKGGYKPYITEDEKLLVTFGKKNTIYIYNLENNKLLHTIKTLSNVSRAAISRDKQRLAVKNTSGSLAVISLENGGELCRSAMEYTEGEPMVFLNDDGSMLLDFDRKGRTMLFDCSNGEHQILDGPKRGVKWQKPRTAYIQYDRYTNQIYKFMADDYGDSPGQILVSAADADHIAFEVIQEFPQILPNHLKGISFCKTHNYYMDNWKNQLVITDKCFSELSRIDLPSQYIRRADQFRVSPCEKYVFLDFGKQCDYTDFEAAKTAKSVSCLYALDTMTQVAEYDYDYVSDGILFDEDKKFILATSGGSYLETLK